MEGLTFPENTIYHMMQNKELKFSEYAYGPGDGVQSQVESYQRLKNGTRCRPT